MRHSPVFVRFPAAWCPASGPARVLPQAQRRTFSLCLCFCLPCFLFKQNKTKTINKYMENCFVFCSKAPFYLSGVWARETSLCHVGNRPKEAAEGGTCVPPRRGATGPRYLYHPLSPLPISSWCLRRGGTHVLRKKTETVTHTGFRNRTNRDGDQLRLKTRLR